MRAFRVRYFHNVSARAGRGHAGRLGYFANGAATLRRHLSWASAIAAKFSRAAAFQQFTRKSLVTLRAWQRIFVRLRDRRETIPPPGVVARATGSPIAVDRPVRIRAAAEPLAHDMGRRVAFTPLSMRSARRFQRQDDDGRHGPASRERSAQILQTQAGLDPKTLEIVTRVVRKHVRVEDRLMAQDRATAPHIHLPAMPPERAPARARRPHAHRADDAMPDAESPVNQKARPAPAVDVAYLTDEVLKQLDRRLVATCERMGRI